MSYEFPPYRSWTPSRPCQILSYASAVPARSVSNQEIIDRNGLKLPDAMVRRTVGVSSRFVADANLADSDLLTRAARECLEKAGIPVERLSKLIANKFLGDRILPPTASIVQRKLGSNLAFQCMDIDGGANSFLQALDMAARCIAMGDEYVLVVSGGLCHDFTSRTDLRTAFLYGDGAAALLLGPADETHIVGSYFFSNPAYLDQACGIRFIDIASVDLDAPDAEAKMRDLLRLGNWKDSQDFVLDAAKTTVDRLLEGAGLAMGEIDRFLVSESNGPLWESILAHVGIPREKTESMLATHGNTMTANLPLLYAAGQSRTPLLPGQHTLFLSFGEGISGGGILYKH